MIPQRDVDRQNLGKAVDVFARPLKRRRIRTSNLYFIAAITWIHRVAGIADTFCSLFLELQEWNRSSGARDAFYSFGFFILLNPGYFTCTTRPVQGNPRKSGNESLFCQDVTSSDMHSRIPKPLPIYIIYIRFLQVFGSKFKRVRLVLFPRIFFTALPQRSLVTILHCFGLLGTSGFISAGPVAAAEPTAPCQQKREQPRNKGYHFLFPLPQLAKN
jgi:hypothetical protein